MNRKHGQSHGQSQRNFSSQSTRGNRMDREFDYESPRSQQRMSSSQDDSFETGRGYRDTDYDLDGSTYGSGSNSSLFGSNRMSTNGRTPTSYSSDSSYGSDYGDFDTNERTRQPRFQQMDEDRMSNRSSYDSSYGRYAGSQGERGLNRQGSSSERFGYPSNMNAWSGNDRQFNSGRTTGRTMSQGSSQGSSQGWSGSSSQATDRDFDLYGSNGSSQSYNAGYQGQSSYGEGSLGQDWGSQSHSERGHFGKGPKGYRRSDDRIKEEVCETLARNPRIDASEIEVEVSDSMVTLSGTVDSKEIRRAAEMAIENLSGVDDVRNDIRVKKADSFGSSSSKDMGSKSSKTSSTSTSSKGSSSL